jgi:predicted DNA-binding antitoxin AbrB/MazE fold protein
MAITVDAIYENGMLKLATPLPLEEHAKVRVTVHPDPGWVDRSAGMIKWSGDMETLRRLAEDVEFDPQEDS